MADTNEKGLNEHLLNLTTEASKFIKPTLLVDVGNAKHLSFARMVCGDLYGKSSAFTDAWEWVLHFLDFPPVTAANMSSSLQRPMNIDRGSCVVFRCVSHLMQR